MKTVTISALFLLLPLLLAAQNSLDLFIWAGQSNAQGYTGDAAKYPEDGEDLDKDILLNYTVFGKASSDGKWVPMQPQKGRYPAGNFGLELSFARELTRAGYRPGIFKYIRGGTGLEKDWKGPGDGGIYDSMVVGLKAAILQLEETGYPVQVRGFIWIQGETDAGDEKAANTYERNLMEMIAHLRSEVVKNDTLEVILGVDEQQYLLEERPIIREAQQTIAQRDQHIMYTTMYGLPKADRTHLTPAGLVTHGQRIYKAYTLAANSRPAESGQTSFADRWEYIGSAVSEPGQVVWGTSPVIGEDGKTHLYAARWPGSRVEPGLRSHSEIAHYVGNGPEGPFVFSDIALKGSGKDTWDRYGMHNPTIHRINDQYVLLYIANDNYQQPPHPSNQKIGMALSNTPYGPCNKVHGHGLLLEVPNNPRYWNFYASNGMNNPALLEHPNGRFYHYFKSEKARMGLAVSDKLTGPYVQMPFPLTKNEQAIEDGNAFRMGDRFCLLTTDNHGLVEKGGGIRWQSIDGINFEQKEQGFYPAEGYLGKEKLANAINRYAGELIKFERHQLLMEHGKPRYLYVTSGYPWFGGEAPVSYSFKYN
jgi:hypothetical protein